MPRTPYVYSKRIDGIELKITVHPYQTKRSVKIEGDETFYCLIRKNSFGQRLTTNLPNSFHHQSHKSVHEALKTIVNLYKQMPDIYRMRKE